MATEPYSGTRASTSLQGPATHVSQEIAAEAALGEAPQSELDGSKRMTLNAATARVPVEIDVAVPIRNFRIRNLLALGRGQVIATQWLEGEDMPLGAKGAQLAWTEFEVIDQKLAARITRLV
jgi:flagellar motor switch protein FliN/FliY